jgi:hypothetical protein
MTGTTPEQPTGSPPAETAPTASAADIEATVIAQQTALAGEILTPVPTAPTEGLAPGETVAPTEALAPAEGAAPTEETVGAESIAPAEEPAAEATLPVEQAPVEETVPAEQAPDQAAAEPTAQG